MRCLQLLVCLFFLVMSAATAEAQLAYMDQNNDIVTNLMHFDHEAFYWDGGGFWRIDPETGLAPSIQTINEMCVFVYYETSDCTGAAFISYDSSGRVICSTSGTNWTPQIAAFTPSTCYLFDFGSCFAMPCPGEALTVVPAGTAPDLSTANVPPFRLVRN